MRSIPALTETPPAVDTALYRAGPFSLILGEGGCSGLNPDSDHPLQVMTWSVSQCFNLVIRLLVRLHNEYVIIYTQ